MTYPELGKLFQKIASNLEAVSAQLEKAHDNIPNEEKNYLGNDILSIRDSVDVCNMKTVDLLETLEDIADNE